jgi:hypothetical protein
VSWALTVTWPDGSAASVRNGVRWIIWPAGYGPEIFVFPADAHERVVTIFGPTLHSPCYDTAGRQVAVLPRDDSWTEHTRRIAVPDSVAYCKLYAPPIHPDGYYASTYAWLTWRAPSGRFVVGN